jgi:hypothetical protein
MKQKKKYEDIENSIHNSLLYNKPTIQDNCYDFFYNVCFWSVPFGIIIVIIMIIMIITIILVKKLS